MDSGSMRGDGIQRSSRSLGWPEGREMMSYPFDMMLRFTDEMDRFFGGLTAGAPRERGMSTWYPRAEMLERGEKMVVRVELPGLEKNDVRVSVTNDALVIEGERRLKDEQQTRGFYRSEWSYGRFHRELPLPETVDPKDVRAHFENGVLEVEMPQPHRVGTKHDIPIQ